jgi:hypothetical protein
MTPFTRAIVVILIAAIALLLGYGWVLIIRDLRGYDGSYQRRGECDPSRDEASIRLPPVTYGSTSEGVPTVLHLDNYRSPECYSHNGNRIAEVNGEQCTVFIYQRSELPPVSYGEMRP